MQICKNVANVSRSPIVGGCLMMHLKIIYLLQKVLLEPMGMRFPLWSRVVSGLRHHLMKTNIWHNALKKGQVTVRAPLWASLVGPGVFVNLKMIQDITFGGGREIHTWHLDKRHGWFVCCQDLVDLRISVTYVETYSSRKFKLNNHIVKIRLKVPKMRNCVHVVGDWWF